MAKKVIKEIIILLLISIAILLILGIVLYEYIPNNKVIPKVEKYEKSAEIEQAVANANAEENTKVVLTYEITNSDLNMYKKTNEYVPIKYNPFEEYVEPTEETTDNGGGTTNKNTGNNTSNNGSTNNKLSGTLFEKGTTK